MFDVVLGEEVVVDDAGVGDGVELLDGGTTSEDASTWTYILFCAGIFESPFAVRLRSFKALILAAVEEGAFLVQLVIVVVIVFPSCCIPAPAPFEGRLLVVVREDCFSLPQLLNLASAIFAFSADEDDTPGALPEPDLAPKGTNFEHECSSRKRCLRQYSL